VALNPTEATNAGRAGPGAGTLDDGFVSEIGAAFADGDQERVSALFDWADANLTAEEQDALAQRFRVQTPGSGGTHLSSGAAAVLAVALVMKARGAPSLVQLLRLDLSDDERRLVEGAIAHLPCLMRRSREGPAPRGYDWSARRRLGPASPAQ